MSRSSRIARIVAVAAASLAVPATAHADAAGPTDFRSGIVSIEPDVGVADLSIEGGDAFVAIEVERGHRVVVLGYELEPYLLIDESGDVFENVRSFATYDNEDRYGNADAPDTVDASAAPEWRRIGSGGAWAWHDHRAHWMGAEPPIGLEPGDSLPDQVVPIEVDGRAVAVTVRTTLVGGPSPWPALFGLVLGIAVVGAATLAGRATVNLAALLVALASLWVGAAQYRHLPAATGPLVTWWLLPAVAVGCGLAVIAVYGRSVLVEQGLTAMAGVQLVLWAVRRRSGLTTAVLPTDLPFWFDRTVSAAALTGGAMIVVVTLRSLLRPAGPAGPADPTG